MLFRSEKKEAEQKQREEKQLELPSSNIPSRPVVRPPPSRPPRPQRPQPRNPSGDVGRILNPPPPAPVADIVPPPLPSRDVEKDDRDIADLEKRLNRLNPPHIRNILGDIQKKGELTSTKNLMISRGNKIISDYEKRIVQPQPPQAEEKKVSLGQDRSKHIGSILGDIEQKAGVKSKMRDLEKEALDLMIESKILNRQKAVPVRGPKKGPSSKSAPMARFKRGQSQEPIKGPPSVRKRKEPE